MNDDLHISHEGLELIKRWEGFVPHLYQDIVGIWTLGIGHVVNAQEKIQYANGITLEQGLDILAKDVKRFEDAIKKNITVELNINQFSALVSLTFNCGTSPISPGHGIYNFLNSGNFTAIPKEFLLWCKAGGKVNQGLLNRRKDELQLFLKPVATAEKPETDLSDEEKTEILNLVYQTSTMSVDDLFHTDSAT